MTPEERAVIIDAAFGRPEYGERLQLAIVDAIRLAIEDERELCAHICDEMGRDIVGQWFGNEDFRRGANRCAHLIRNQLSVALNPTQKTPD